MSCIISSLLEIIKQIGCGCYHRECVKFTQTLIISPVNFLFLSDSFVVLANSVTFMLKSSNSITCRNQSINFNSKRWSRKKGLYEQVCFVTFLYSTFERKKNQWMQKRHRRSFIAIHMITEQLLYVFSLLLWIYFVCRFRCAESTERVRERNENA